MTRSRYHALSDADLDDRLRRMLSAVAARVEDTAADATAPSNQKRSPVGRATAVVVAAAGLTVSLAAAAVILNGSEYVDRIPPAGAIASVTLDGETTWMVDAFHPDGCGGTTPGVELIAESRNRVGGEWDSIGVMYGDYRFGTCRLDRSAWLSDPARYDVTGNHDRSGWTLVAAVHPQTTAVRVTLDGETRLLPVHVRDGGGFALFAVPSDVRTATTELVRGDETVPGSRRELDPRRPMV